MMELGNPTVYNNLVLTVDRIVKNKLLHHYYMILSLFSHNFKQNYHDVEARFDILSSNLSPCLYQRDDVLSSNSIKIKLLNRNLATIA